MDTIYKDSNEERLPKMLEERLAQVALDINPNWFVTIPFKSIRDFNGNRVKPNASHLPAINGFVRGYANWLSRQAHKRWRRPRLTEEFVPFIAYPEIKDKQGKTVLPHYHVLVSFPEECELELLKKSFMFWRRMGDRVCGMPVTPVFVPIFNVEQVSNYVLKNLDDDNTIQYTIMRGINQ